MLSRSLKRSIFNASSRPGLATATRPLQPSQVRWGTSDYGSGKGDPKGENPQDQGANPSADKEHPGAPPPKEGEGSGGSPTKGTSSGHNTGEAKQAQQKRSYSTYAGARRQFSTGSSLWAKDKPKSTEGLKPKIHDESAPSKGRESEDVKKHNEEMEGRSDRAHEQIDPKKEEDKADAKFWGGGFLFSDRWAMGVL